MADGEKDEEARLVAKGYRGPNLGDGSVDTFGRVRLRPSHLRVISLEAFKKWSHWSLNINDALSQAGGHYCKVFLRDPAEWSLEGTVILRDPA